MNCRQGDIAVLVHSKAGNEGAIVTCVQFVGLYDYGGIKRDSWLIDRELPAMSAGIYTTHCPDAWLRPLRDGELPDETLSWAGLPETVSA